MHPTHQLGRRRGLRALAALFSTAVLVALFAPSAIGLERRRAQFQYEPAHLVVPFPYDLPGIGKGIGWTGLAANVLDTSLDAYAIFITGEAGGKILGFDEIPLVPERLLLRAFFQRIDRAAVRQYPTRGMDSPGSLYNLIEASQADEDMFELRLTLFDRRLEAYVGSDRFTTSTVRIRDAQGTPIVDFPTPYKETSRSAYVGVLIDQTDDYADPRKGVRLEVSVSHANPASAQDADFRVWNYKVSGYVPLGRISTLLLHYFQSDAQLLHAGNTDPTQVAAQVGLQCAAGDIVCQAVRDQYVQTIIAQRAHGTSASLGGQNLLRSYPMGRFQGAYTVFYGSELRWNLTEEVTPFDYFIWKDVRTNVQVAFFAETGSVGESRSAVGHTFRSSYGIGLHMVSGSGFVYRADVATGNEGGEVTIIFMYPY